MTCVIGVGNELRGDDAVGLVVIQLLKDAPATLHVCEGEPIALLDTWEGHEHVVVVDGMRSGAAPGTTRVLEARDEALPPELSQSSTHLLGVAEAVELARALDRLPDRLTVYAIEIGDVEPGAGLSAPVAEAAARVAAEIRGML